MYTVYMRIKDYLSWKVSLYIKKTIFFVHKIMQKIREEDDKI